MTICGQFGRQAKGARFYYFRHWSESSGLNPSVKFCVACYIYLLDILKVPFNEKLYLALGILLIGLLYPIKCEDSND